MEVSCSFNNLSSSANGFKRVWALGLGFEGLITTPVVLFTFVITYNIPHNVPYQHRELTRTSEFKLEHESFKRSFHNCTVSFPAPDNHTWWLYPVPSPNDWGNYKLMQVQTTQGIGFQTLSNLDTWYIYHILITINGGQSDNIWIFIQSYTLRDKAAHDQSTSKRWFHAHGKLGIDEVKTYPVCIWSTVA